MNIRERICRRGTVTETSVPIHDFKVKLGEKEVPILKATLAVSDPCVATANQIQTVASVATCLSTSMELNRDAESV